MKKRLVVDARCVAPQLHGMARYTSLLATGLAAIQRDYAVTFLMDSRYRELGKRAPWDAFDLEWVDTPFLARAELWRIPRLLKRLRADAFHSPTFSSYPTVLMPCPWISTVHDLNHLIWGSNAQKIYYALVLKPFAQRATSLFSISEVSRAELAGWLGWERSRIGLAENALDPGLATPPSGAALSSALLPHGLKQGAYFFCLSNPKPHKNVRLAVESHRAYRALGGQWPLVLSLQGGYAGEGVIELGSVGEQDARSLLAGAGALVFPSLYEGLGLPPMEAAALGVPSLLSDIAAHREAMSTARTDEVVWLSPQMSATEAWAQAMLRAERGELKAPSASTRAQLLARFSPARLAAVMDPAYRRVLGLQA